MIIKRRSLNKPWWPYIVYPALFIGVVWFIPDQAYKQGYKVASKEMPRIIDPIFGLKCDISAFSACQEWCTSQ